MAQGGVSKSVLHTKSKVGLFLLAIVLFCSVATAFGQTADSTPMVTYPMNVLQDSGKFTFYVNEEILVTEQFVWRKDGSFTSDYTMNAAGQSMGTSLNIDVDTTGHWQAMDMQTVIGEVKVAREGNQVKVESPRGNVLLDLKPETRVFENFSPALMSQAVISYDQEAGGKQTFPLFIIPSVIMDASLERLDTVERTVGDVPGRFTRYRYGLPGVDVILWVDEDNRICYGDVPAQHGAYVRDGYEVLGVKAETDSLLSQPKYEVVIDSNVGVPMRDGIELATDIYRPDADGTFPVVLVRTPYKKELNELQGKYYARRGYVYAVQDCRGRFSSPGTWVPFFNEPKDGYDAIEWLAVRPWANGKVGMIGASYLGWVQWWAAREHPPHLVTIIPNVSPPDPYFNIPYEYGAFFLLGSIWWADILETDATADVTGKTMSRINERDYARLLDHLPVIDLDSIVLGKRNQYWRSWIEHPDNNDFWEPVNFLHHLEQTNIPVYNQSGWFDGDGIGSKLNYLAMKEDGHPYQKLVLGPWGHTAQATRTGPHNTDFGPNAIIDLEKSYTRWLDRWLLGIENGIDNEPLVSLFVMGSNDWLYGDVYPLPQTKFTKLYLVSKGNANSSEGDGWASFEPPADTVAAIDTFTYDPGDPTPDPRVYVEPEETPEKDTTQAEVLDSIIAVRRAYYGKVDAERSDILVYDTPPLEQAVTVAGPISAVLYAASDAKDTDWHMRLSTIDSNGVIFPLVHGVIRARFRDSFARPKLLEPGTVYEYHLDLWQTGITIPAGGVLRVEVASASFPMFSRNLNTGGHNETETEFVRARQTIYHDAEHPSHVLLPVIPDPQFGQASEK